MNLSKNIDLVIDERLVYWKKTRIPTIDRANDVWKTKKKMCDTWNSLEK